MATLLFFGKLSDVMGEKLRTLTLPPEVTTISRLIDYVASENEVVTDAMREVSVRYVVNEIVVDIDSSIGNDDEIAFLPPVSGG